MDFTVCLSVTQVPLPPLANAVEERINFPVSLPTSSNQDRELHRGGGLCLLGRRAESRILLLLIPKPAMAEQGIFILPNRCDEKRLKERKEAKGAAIFPRIHVLSGLRVT